MSRTEVTRAFLVGEVEGLEPLDMILVAPMDQPLEVVELTRTEEGALEVRIPGRPPILPPLSPETRRKFVDLGFSSEDASDPTKPWRCAVDDADAAVNLMRSVHADAYGVKPDAKLNIMHGSHRIEIEAARKLERTRERIESVLESIAGTKADQDDDGDFSMTLGEVRVTIAPRSLPDGEVVIRVFAITNVGVNVTSELGLFLARLNFGMMFGRFALDAENRSIWFDETLLGETFREDELRFVVNMVATTADGWDDRLKQLFGGSTYQEVLAGRVMASAPVTKPGQGVGMYL